MRWFVWVALLVLACEPSEAERQRRAQEAADHEEAERAAIAREREGFCTRERAELWKSLNLPGMLVRRWEIERDMAAVWVEPGLWSQVSLDARTGLGKWISLCLEPEKFPRQLKWVSWRHPNTDVEFGVWLPRAGGSDSGVYRSRNE